MFKIAYRLSHSRIVLELRNDFNWEDVFFHVVSGGKACFQVFSILLEIREGWVYFGLLKGCSMENLFSLKHLETIISAQLSPSNYPTAHLLLLMHFHINKKYVFWMWLNLQNKRSHLSRTSNKLRTWTGTNSQVKLSFVCLLGGWPQGLVLL